MLSVAELNEHIDQTTKSLFRLELLDRYARGEPGPTPERKQPWLDHLRREHEAGIRRYRVHVLSTPLNDYLRFECEWGYAPNSAAGEEIHILDVSERSAPPDLVDHDFWLIDDTSVIRMIYDDEGRFVGAEVEAPTALPVYQRARDAALTASESFETWWTRHPEEWRANRAA